MRKKLLLVLLSMVMVGTTGCIEAIDLDEEQQDKFVQYSVFSVLEHDKNYLVNLEHIKEPEYIEIPEIPTEEPTEAPTEDNNSGVQGGNNGGTNGSTVNVENLADAMDIKGVSLTYKGMKVCDSFPESDGTPVFVIKAVQGKKLVVLNFDMTNTTDADLDVNVSSKNISMKGIFNGVIKTNALITLLPEALNAYVGTIPAGGTVSTVLVFEMSDGYVANLSEITIDVKSENGTKSIKVQ